MKKLPGKFSSPAPKKIKASKPPEKKNLFSSYQEDFVITAQEEREGGFLGSYRLKTGISFK